MRPSRLAALAALMLAFGLPALAASETAAACKRACREPITECARLRAPLKLKKAKRICRQEMVPVCRAEGTVECERAPHYRGTYTFVGTRTGSTCTRSTAFLPADPISVLVTVLNRRRDEFDAQLAWGNTGEAHGTGASFPWTVRGGCIVEDLDLCGVGTLSVHGMPPRTLRAPRPLATLDVQLYFYRPEYSECVVSYAGELQFLSAVPGVPL